MKKEAIPNNLKLWGIKFLIEDFYYKKKELEANRAIAIDKMQTFWMIFSRSLNRRATGEDKKLISEYIRYLRDLHVPVYKMAEKPQAENFAGWFSSKAAEERFFKIYNDEHFDHLIPEDWVLAFNLADGILEEPEIKEYAVLESLFFESNSMEKNPDKFRADYENAMNDSINKWASEILKHFSNSEIEDKFKELTKLNIEDYFLYQKQNNYPLVNLQLYETWVKNVLVIIEQIIKSITHIKPLIQLNSNEKLKYFRNLLRRENESQEGREQSLFYYLDENFNEKITAVDNDLIHTIYDMFSDLDIEYFDTCHNKSCSRTEKKQPPLLVKYPKKNRKYCSNNCAAYAITSHKRKSGGENL